MKGPAVAAPPVVPAEKPFMDPELVERSIKKVEDDMKDKISSLAPQIISHLGLSKYRSHQLSATGSLIYLLISGLILFARSDFFNV